VTKLKKVLNLIFTLCFLASGAYAQKAEITISLNEQFFDALLDAMFQYAPPPEFPIAARTGEVKGRKGEEEIFQSSGSGLGSSFLEAENAPLANPPCNETIRLLRETNNVRTSVRLRDGKISAPIAFSGSYSPPFIGCVDFAGVADADIDLEFDQDGQRLIGRVRIVNVALNGTGGVGGTVIACLVQSSIDKKINPIEILRMDKVSFVVPIQNSGSLKMKATGIRQDIAAGSLNVHIAYEFQKGP
jgi:hypothetical protein